MKELPVHYFELYKLAVEMADRVSARRTAANAFFITVQGALASLLGFAVNTFDSLPATQNFGIIFFCIIGIVLSYTWAVLIKSYRDLNSAKFSVILEMEKNLSVAPFGDEWKYLKKDPVSKWRKRYAELTSVEKNIPWTFAAIYLFVLIVIIVR
jgi:predicted RND superfamily exporter protein